MFGVFLALSGIKLVESNIDKGEMAKIVGICKVSTDKINFLILQITDTVQNASIFEISFFCKFLKSDENLLCHC